VDILPEDVGFIGFDLGLDPGDRDAVWVCPMDGTEVWPRVSPGGKPSVYIRGDAGKRWTRQDKGVPKSQAWWTVKRQAMTADAHKPVGLYFGTTAGEIWGSRTEGGQWGCLVG